MSYVCVVGSVHYVSEAGKLTKCFKADGSVLKLMLVESKNTLVTITNSLMLTQHSILPSGDLKEIIKVGQIINSINRKTLIITPYLVGCFDR